MQRRWAQQEVGVGTSATAGTTAFRKQEGRGIAANAACLVRGMVWVFCSGASYPFKGTGGKDERGGFAHVCLTTASALARSR